MAIESGLENATAVKAANRTVLPQKSFADCEVAWIEPGRRQEMFIVQANLISSPN
jgi:hypothetical protein